MQSSEPSCKSDIFSRSRDSPGPSAYDTDSPGKRQLLSDRHREPAWSMGSGARSDPTNSRGSASLPGVGEIMYHVLANIMLLMGWAAQPEQGKHTSVCSCTV